MSNIGLRGIAAICCFVVYLLCCGLLLSIGTGLIGLQSMEQTKIIMMTVGGFFIPFVLDIQFSDPISGTHDVRRAWGMFL